MVAVAAATTPRGWTLAGDRRDGLAVPDRHGRGLAGVARLAQRPTALVLTGVSVWVATIVVGMMLRVITHAGDRTQLRPGGLTGHRSAAAGLAGRPGRSWPAAPA